MLRKIAVCIAILAGIGVGAWLIYGYLEERALTITVSRPTTRRAATQATTATAARVEPKTYMDVVLATHPGFPTTQPLPVPVDLWTAARLTFDDAIHLDQVSHLWITRDDAEPTQAVLKSAATDPTHVIRERVVFVHRWPDEKGVWQPMLVCRKSVGDEGFELVRAGARQNLGNAQGYLWDRAFSWNDVIVVPTVTGVSIIRPDRRPMELHHEFKIDGTNSGAPPPAPQVLLDWRGLIAWMPWEPGASGSDGAIRFVNDQWIDLDSAGGWPKRLLHLVPLLDGSIIQIIANKDGATSVALASLDPAEVNEQTILDLVEELSDLDPDKRAAAFAELTRYGAGVWPVLQKLAPDQPPEAKRRIEELLDAKEQPTLGGMTVVPGTLRVVARSRAGAALLYSATGVSIPSPEPEDEPRIHAPAWLLVLPGRPIQLAPADMVRDYVPGKTRFLIVGEEIIVTDDVQGPRWWLSNHFSQPLLKKSELEFQHLVGFDQRGRWLFRKTPDSQSPTLVIDPTLPDPTPRLPAWDYPVLAGTVGWTREGWPAIKRGGAWVLNEQGWRALDERKEKMFTDPSDIPPATMPATVPASMPASPQASTSPTSEFSDVPILVDSDGTRYFDGRESLRALRADGREITWIFPPQAIGQGDVTLIRAGEDQLFLFNEPGRVLRIKPTPEGPEPFKLEATFTRRIPSVDHPIRIWLDPAGRINMIPEPDHLVILFPTGRIPRHIAEMMPAQELRDAEGE